MWRGILASNLPGAMQVSPEVRDKENAWLYRGKVGHERLMPRENSFRYGAYFLLLDLNEIDEVATGFRFFSRNKLNLFSLYDSDHGARDGTRLREWIDTVLTGAGVSLDGGRVMLLTFPRVLGFRFFPVSYWYCYHQDGTLRAILAEVNNTFHQNHNYLLHKKGEPLAWGEKLTAQKIFYVSPFIEISPIEYHFVFTEPGDDLKVEMDVLQDEHTLLMARLRLARHELGDKAILGSLFRYGPMSLRAKFLIYWQALKIRSKGIRTVPRPAPPEERTSI
jgi:DUF1365 family protein